MSNYWDRWQTTRSRRRTFLAGAGAAGAGMASLALVGCGDDDDDDDGGEQPTSAPTSSSSGGNTPASGSSPTQGATTQRKVGGTLRYPYEGLSSGDPPTLFPFENLTYLAQHVAVAHYSRLLRSQSGEGIDPEDHTKLEGDLAQEWEQPDETTYTFKFKPNIKWHNKPPMNGRAATASDWVKTYEAFLAKSQNGPGWKSVVASITAPDESTLQIKLNSAFAPFLTTHASSAEAVWFIPVETIDNDQVKSDPVGTGPYVFAQYETGVAIRWDRNKDFFDEDLPNYDRIEGSLFNDSQRILAALQAGDIDLSGLSGAVYNEAKSKLDPKGKDHFEQTGVLGAFYFNFDNVPWNDARVRQALSMAIDRDGLLKVLDQTGKGTWQSMLSPALKPYFMSPKEDEKEFGENAKYFKKNIAEAKALLSAAGHETVQFKIYCNYDRYGPVAKQTWELLQSLIKEAGFEAELVPMEYASYIQSIFVGNIPSDGVGLGPLIGSPRDPDNIFFSNFHSSAPRHNWGGTPIPEQADFDARMSKSREILKLDERVEYIKDIQRDMAAVMNIVPYTGSAGYAYTQPWMENAYWKNGYGVHIEALWKSWFNDERLKKG